MSKNNLPEEVFSDTENAETYEQLDLSELIYGMPMGEADFMLNEAQEIQYNEMCQDCRQDCKQSFRCQVVECPKFRVRRSRKKDKTVEMCRMIMENVIWHAVCRMNIKNYLCIVCA